MDLEDWLVGIAILAVFSYATAQVGVEILQEAIDWLLKPMNWKMKIAVIAILLAVLASFRKRMDEVMPPEAVKVKETIKKILIRIGKKLWGSPR